MGRGSRWDLLASQVLRLLPIKGFDYFDGLERTKREIGVFVGPILRTRWESDDHRPTGALYIGITTTNEPEAPTDPNEYNWNYIKGEEGIRGEVGPSGLSSYSHIKYSNDEGATFTGNNGEDVGDWLGTYAILPKSTLSIRRSTLGTESKATRASQVRSESMGDKLIFIRR